ncbi:Kelch repeat protein [Aspergillus undulatus]|uniref:Kelch repeat protein n=1 Tax=Aspergillus undulatus TaxID=1810928 RepID=UPI003CCCB87A
MARAVWKKLLVDPSIQRSSQSLSVVGSNAYIYGGELRPREPVDSSVYYVPLEPGEFSTSGIAKLTNHPTTPSPRVGTASTTVNEKIYIFSGRGGTAMTPIEESGAIWVFDTGAETGGEWSQVHPADPAAPYPVGRSYHALTSNGQDKFFLHAGCPEKGRLSDLWAFDIPNRKWTELVPAPGPERGGTSIAYLDGKIYRMNGFDGKTEQGGALDVFDLSVGSWTAIAYAADGVNGPSPRSVSCLLPVIIDGKPSLVTMFGEHDPSSLGHQGAGKMLSDIWAFHVGSSEWAKVDVDVEGGGEAPPARGWFDADVMGVSESRIVVHGGLAESNERLGDVWILDFQ